MKTDQFIDMLSTNLLPVDQRRMLRVLAVALALGGIAAIGTALLVLGLRPDYLSPHAAVFTCVKLLFAGSAAAFAWFYLMKSVRPSPRGKIPIAVALPFAVIAVLAIASLSFTLVSHWKETVAHGEWLECLASIPLIAIIPFAVLVWAVRQQTAPTNFVLTGALIGLVAGSISAMGYALHCVTDSLPFIAFWYGGTIALCTLAGALIGPRLLRW